MKLIGFSLLFCLLVLMFTRDASCLDHERFVSTGSGSENLYHIVHVGRHEGKRQNEKPNEQSSENHERPFHIRMNKKTTELFDGIKQLIEGENWKDKGETISRMVPKHSGHKQWEVIDNLSEKQLSRREANLLKSNEH